MFPAPRSPTSVQFADSTSKPAEVEARAVSVTISCVPRFKSAVAHVYGTFSVSSSLSAACTSVAAILPAGTFVILEAV